MIASFLAVLLVSSVRADPAPAGSLQDVVIKGAEKDEPSAGKPAFDVPVDAYESVRPTLKPDESLLLAESPALATWNRSRPDRLREPLIEPWNDSLVQLSELEFFPPKAAAQSWSLSLVDEDGKPFISFGNKGTPPQTLTWNGRGSGGDWMLAGHAYSAVYKLEQSSVTSRTVMGRQLQYAGLVRREPGGVVIGLDSSALFGADRGQKDVAAAGQKLLRAAADWIKRRDYGRPLRVKAFAADAELAKAQAAAVRGWLASELSLPEGRVASEAEAAPASQQRIDLVIDER